VKLPPPVPLQAYTIDYLVLDQSAEAHAGGQVLEFAAGAYNIDGKLLNVLRRMQFERKPRRQRSPGSRCRSFVPSRRWKCRPQLTWLRVAVRDVNTDRIGTLEIPLPLGTDRQAMAGNPSNQAGSANPPSDH